MSFIVGVGMTPFRYDVASTVKGLTAAAITAACSDAGVSPGAIDSVFFANSGQGVLEGQHAVRGQVALRAMGIQGVPVTNVENACAGGSTALTSAIAAVRAGMADVALAVGVEKMSDPDRSRSFEIFAGGWDVTAAEVTMARLRTLGTSVKVPTQYHDLNGKSLFMDVYAALIKDHMARFGTTTYDLAVVTEKNRTHAAGNPGAQFRSPMTAAEVLASRMVTWPLTVPMCAPLADGAAAAIVCREESLNRFSRGRAVRIAASALGTGTDRNVDDFTNHLVSRTARRAYDEAGIGPHDIDVAEVHDATSFAEIWQCENLGLCDFGMGAELARSGDTAIGGRIPVNPSGGLECKGHPIAATGLGQVHEIVTQLRGEAETRQVEGASRGLVENGGGFIGFEEAVASILILER
ncbi:thiolase family protein [Nocardia flavorosea]|uniref:Thiolase family protein n=1 Tax=Nocardia flavorosea TaxID=53429 RepID=A0A846YHE8_9NOCA|nr:thiolase family protein [Nocardia flavorosea]NKY58333.1 thiolase family protein [Nocardia flavorosea]